MPLSRTSANPALFSSHSSSVGALLYVSPILRFFAVLLGTNLITLNFQITDEGLSLVYLLSSLETLDLWENIRLTNLVLARASSCTKLASLRVCGRTLNDMGVCSLASACPGTLFLLFAAIKT